MAVNLISLLMKNIYYIIRTRACKSGITHMIK